MTPTANQPEPKYLDANALIALSQPKAEIPTPPPGWKLSSELSIWNIGEGVPEITRQAGPIINNPQLYNVFLGDWTSAYDKERIKRLNQFTADLVNSSYMTILAQYGCTKPGNFIKSVIIKNTSKVFTDSSLQQVLQRSFDGLLLPEPKPNDVFMIYLANDASVEDQTLKISMCGAKGNAFGYHHYFKTVEGNKCYYSIIPGLTDACVNGTCYGQINCSLKLTQSQEARQTQVASHEIIEMVTNPESTAWYDVLQGGEIGDICNGYSDTIKVGENSWYVQQIYSKNDDIKTNGKNVCVTRTDSTQAAPTGNITSSIVGRLIPDINSPYNLLGAVSLMTIVLLIGNKSIVGRVAFALLGFAAGFFITDVIRQSLTIDQKNLVKDQFKKVGNIAS